MQALLEPVRGPQNYFQQHYSTLIELRLLEGFVNRFIMKRKVQKVAYKPTKILETDTLQKWRYLDTQKISLLQFRAK